MTDVKTDAAIEIQANGPYVVTGSVPLVRIARDRDEPSGWRVVETLEAGDEYWLCRCGGSTEKPFCADVHLTNDFDGTEMAPADSYQDRAKELGGGVLDDRSICGHASFCANRVTNVWKAAKHLDEDAELKNTVYEMVRRCPSGALTLAIDGELDPVTVAIEENGPIHVTGGVAVHRSDGQSFETRNRVLLCRCGNSKNKPLCDGTHKEIGFVG